MRRRLAHGEGLVYSLVDRWGNINRSSTLSLVCGDRGDWSFVPKESSKDVVVIVVIEQNASEGGNPKNNVGWFQRFFRE
jgi:hypothetical protein